MNRSVIGNNYYDKIVRLSRYVMAQNRPPARLCVDRVAAPLVHM